MTNEDLLKWAETTLIWGQKHPLVEFAEWLISGDPDRWHAAAMRWNWDSGLTPMYWIIEQPQCDAATALEIFYKCEPTYKWAPESEEYELVASIRKKWIANSFSRWGIEFILPSYIESSYQGKCLDLVPQNMRVSLPGREIVAPIGAGYGIPAFMYPADES